MTRLLLAALCGLAAGRPADAPSAPAAKLASAPLATPSPAPSPPGHLPLRSNRPPTPTQQRDTLEIAAMLSDPAYALRPSGDAPPLEVVCRWRHPAVAVLAQRSRASPLEARRVREIVDRLSATGTPTERVASALLRAELGDVGGLELLAAKFLDANAPIPERCLAAHALARFPDRLDPAALTKMLESWIGPPDEPELFQSERPVGGDAADLVGAAAWALVSSRLAAPSYDPAADRWVDKLSEQPDARTRQAAAIAHRGRSWESIPRVLNRLLDDPDPAVRRSALAALTERPTEAGRPTVLRMVHDVDLEVACAAVERLALYPGLETTRRVAELVAHPSPRIRQSAVRAAGRLGQHGMALHATQDPAAAVRAASAEALAALDTPESARALKSLLENDRSTEVQSAAVDAAQRLSDDLAVDVLLAGLDSAAVRTRERSAQALARYLPQSSDFPIHESAAGRAERIEMLRKDWSAKAASVPRRPASSPLDSPRVAELVRAWHVAGGPMRRRAEEELRGLSPAALPAIEAEFLAADAVPGEAFQQQVLAALDPAYAALPKLAATEQTVVEAAANQLAGEFARRKPTVLQALLIARAALRGDSRSVWTKSAAIVLRDYGADQDPDAEQNPLLAAAVDRLVEAGLAHPDEWVRLAICERLEAAPSPRRADRLAALMNDPSERVRRSAIRAVGAASDPGLAESLRAALRSPSIPVQLEAAAQLCRMGEREGLDALRRLSISPDPEVRRRVVAEAAAAVDLVDRDAVLRLLTNALADAKLEVREQAIGGLERIVGYASNASGRPAPHDEQVARWKKAMASLLNPDDGRDKSWESLREIQRAHERMRTPPLAH